VLSMCCWHYAPLAHSASSAVGGDTLTAQCKHKLINAAVEKQFSAAVIIPAAFIPSGCACA